MNIISRFGEWLQTFGKRKFFDYPTISGGFEIFRNYQWDSGWNASKQLRAYKTSLYVYACVSKIAQKTASIEFSLKKIKNSSGDTQEVFDHEALDLIYRPNPFQTKTEFFEKYMINKKLTGQAFVLKIRDESGKVRELWNLRPDLMTIVKDKELFIKAYEFNKMDGKIVFEPEDIIYDAYPSPLDEYGGCSPISAAQVRIDTEWAAANYQANFFKNNARPDFLLTSEKKIDASNKENIKQEWEKRHKGTMNAGKGAFLEGGLKYQQVSISQRDMDYIESLKMTRDDILTAFGVPKVIVAITEDVNYANANTGMQIFLAETITPEIRRITEKLNEHLVYPEYGDIYFLEYEDPVPANEKEMAEIQGLRISNGTMLINEAREEWGMPPVVGGWSLYKPFSETAVGGLPQNGAAKTIDIGAETKEKAFEKHTPAKDKRSVFKGRRKALRVLEVKDQLKKVYYDTLREEVKRKGVLTKTKKTPLIKTEIRDAYSDYVVKAIDKKGTSFKPYIIEFADEQKKRLLASIDLGKSIAQKSVTDDLKQWAKSEKKLAATFAIPFIEEFLAEAGESAVDTVNPAETFVMSESVEKWIKQRAKEFGNETTATTLEKVARTLGEGLEAGEGIAEMRDRVNGVFEEFSTYRAELIARTEATAANNRGFIEGYKQSGVANGKEWIATKDSRTREEHVQLDGEIVKLEDDFSNGLPYPQEPNCRCVVAPAFIED